MKRRVRIGSRESELAVWQAGFVADCIKKAHPEVEVEIITMKTTGDRILDKSLSQIGGKGLFVKELDIALMKREIDISVHSLKDMPMEVPEELPILAYLKREDPRDVLIFRKGEKQRDGMCIGTSSPRRMVQLSKLFPGCTFTGMRGNVHTRLRKLQEGQCDATVLAMAGLKRLGLERHAGRILESGEMITAAGQGILAVQGRAGENHDYLDCVENQEGRMAALAERAFVRTLNGGCQSPTAAYAMIEGGQIHLKGLYYNEEAKDYVTGILEGNCKSAERVGTELALRLKGRFVLRG